MEIEKENGNRSVFFVCITAVIYIFVDVKLFFDVLSILLVNVSFHLNLSSLLLNSVK